MSKKMLVLIGLVIVLSMALSACGQQPTVSDAISASKSINEFMSNSQVMATELNDDLADGLGDLGVVIEDGMTTVGDVLMSLPGGDIDGLYDFLKDNVK